MSVEMLNETTEANTLPIQVQAILGPAGSGKSYRIREELKKNPKYAILAATTGVAAVNLGNGVVTIHSLLKFFNTESLRTQHEGGWVEKRFISIAKRGFKNVVIDEISMLEAEALQIIFEAACAAGEKIRERQREGSTAYENVEPVGLILTGDFLQLPPIAKFGTAPKYAFYAECWKEFSKNLVRLNTQYRQEPGPLLEALTEARVGNGAQAAAILHNAGVKFFTHPEKTFPGVTLFATNAQVDKYNAERLEELEGQEYKFTAKRWGTPAKEWDNIPDTLIVKPGARVMVLVNCPITFEYVNGDVGEVLEAGSRKASFSERREGKGTIQVHIEDGYLPVRITRMSGYTWHGALGMVVRQNYKTETNNVRAVDWNGPDYDPDDAEFWKAYAVYTEKHTMKGIPYFDPVVGMWVVGEIQYMPVRLGYAITVHKSQGLTLDSVQIDARPLPAGAPGLMYVAMSRVRDIKGLAVIGNAKTLASRIKATVEAKRYA